MIVDFTKLALKFGGGRREPPRLGTEGIVLGELVGGGRATWPRPNTQTASHVNVFAASGTGKTVAVAAALLSEYLDSIRNSAEGNAESLVIVDAKGDLVSAFLSGLCAHAPQLIENVSYLDPFSEFAFEFNLNKLPLGATPVDIRASQLASLVAQISTATGAQRGIGGAGSRQLDLLQNCILGTLSANHPAANLTWALDALTVPNGMTLLAKLTTSARAKAFLAHTTIGEELRTSCSARLRIALASCEQLERVIAAPGCIDLGALTAPGRIVLVDVGSPPGGVEALTGFYANLVVRLLAQRLLERRSPWAGHHTRLVIDEAQIVAQVLSDIAERVLTTGRSRGISLVTMSQGTTLISSASDTLLRVLMTNAPTKIIGRLAVADADLLAREQALRPGVEESVSALRSRFSTAITSLPDREFFLLQPGGGRARFRSGEVDLATWQSARAQERAAVTACQARHAIPASGNARVPLVQAAGEHDDSSPRARTGAPHRRASPWG